MAANKLLPPPPPSQQFCSGTVYAVIYSYFKKGCQKKCARDNPERKWDMINTLFLTTLAVKPTLVTFL